METGRQLDQIVSGAAGAQQHIGPLEQTSARASGTGKPARQTMTSTSAPARWDVEAQLPLGSSIFDHRLIFPGYSARDPKAVRRRSSRTVTPNHSRQGDRIQCQAQKSDSGVVTLQALDDPAHAEHLTEREM